MIILVGCGGFVLVLAVLGAIVQESQRNRYMKTLSEEEVMTFLGMTTAQQGELINRFLNKEIIELKAKAKSDKAELQQAMQAAKARQLQIESQRQEIERKWLAENTGVAGDANISQPQDSLLDDIKEEMKNSDGMCTGDKILLGITIFIGACWALTIIVAIVDSL